MCFRCSFRFEKRFAFFGQHFSIELNEENKKQLLIPRGFAHGFIVLSEEAIFSYKVDNYYSPENDRGIIYNDNLLKIDCKGFWNKNFRKRY